MIENASAFDVYFYVRKEWPEAADIVRAALDLADGSVVGEQAVEVADLMTQEAQEWLKQVEEAAEAYRDGDPFDWKCDERKEA